MGGPWKNKAPIIDRFFKKVVKTETCWLWTAAVAGNNGYGTFWNDTLGRVVRAHRFSYELHLGPIPSGKIIMHKCDNPICVNPDHLIPGSQKENINDAQAKGRYRVSLTGGLKNKKAHTKNPFNHFKRGEKRKFCNKGHDISSDDSVYINKKKPDRGRVCLICNKITKEKWKNKKKEVLNELKKETSAKEEAIFIC